MKSDNLKEIEISKTVEGNYSQSSETVILAGAHKNLTIAWKLQGKDHPHPSLRFF